MLTIGAWMPKGGYTRSSWERLLEKGQKLGEQFRAEETQARDVSSWSGEARDEPVCDRICHHRDNDRDRRCRLLCSTRRERIGGDDQVNPEINEFARQSRQPLDLTLSFSVLDTDVHTFHIAEFA